MQTNSSYMPSILLRFGNFQWQHEQTQFLTVSNQKNMTAPTNSSSVSVSIYDKTNVSKDPRETRRCVVLCLFLLVSNWFVPFHVLLFTQQQRMVKERTSREISVIQPTTHIRRETREELSTCSRVWFWPGTTKWVNKACSNHRWGETNRLNMTRPWIESNIQACLLYSVTIMPTRCTWFHLDDLQIFFGLRGNGKPRMCYQYFKLCRVARFFTWF